MYLPKHFEESRVDVLHGHMRAHPLATIVITVDGELVANHIPMRTIAADDGATVLRGHVARANPLWKSIGAGVPAIAIFQGPDLYISPALYASKREHGKVVPTWNYAVVHAHGALRAIDDAAWLRAFLEGLVDEHEQPRANPWKVSDAPDEFVTQQLRVIVGIEMTVTRLTGKWKASQNRLAQDQQSTIAGLRAAGDPGSRGMADLIERSIAPRT